MINNTLDLSNRVLVESNTLRSLILGEQNTSVVSPSRNDILIHDYQIANSVTLNSILSNFIVNFKQAIKLYSSYEDESDKYFQIINSSSDLDSLGDKTRMFLTVNEGAGSFSSRKLVLDAVGVTSEEGVKQIVKLSSIWFTIVGLTTDQIENYDEIRLSDGMNDKNSMSDYFGSNPFDVALYGSQVSFNEFLKENKATLNCIIENEFYGNQFGEEVASGGILEALQECKYLVCLTCGFYGLKTVTQNNKFKQFEMVNLGYHIPSIIEPGSIDDQYEFTNCSFATIDETTTLVLIFRNRNVSNKYHYIFINDDNYDNIYGFTNLTELVNDQLVIPVDSVFKEINLVKSLDSTSIVLTDYGFWDIQTNNTNSIVYKYSNTKDIKFESDHRYNDRLDKIINPLQELTDTDRIVEYDKIWKYNPTIDKYENGSVKFQNTVSQGNSYYGSTDNFALYDCVFDQNDECISPVKLLVKIDQGLYNDILFSNSTLLGLFMRWMYDQVVYQDKGEHYLNELYSDFAKNVNEVALTHTIYSNQIWSANQTADFISEDSKFKSIPTIVTDRNGSATSLYDYCSSINDLINNPNLDELCDSNWLVESNKVKTIVNDVFKEQYDNLHLSTIVNDLISKLVANYKSLDYFKSYLYQKFSDDFKLLNLTSCESEVSRDSIISTIKTVLEYIRSKVQTALVLGNYDSSKQGNDCYPNINQYLYQNSFGLQKYDISKILSPTNIQSLVTTAVSSIPFFKSFPTFGELQTATVTNNNLFKVDDSQVKFLSLSHLVDTNGNLKINWDTVRNWLFPNGYDVETDQIKLLKTFIRTQFYRPLFFNPTSFDTFSSNTSAYWCKTKKTYVNHDGDVKELCFNTADSILDYTSIDTVGSNLNDSTHIKDISFSLKSNVLSYKVYSDRIYIVDNKFVYKDVEYYTIPTPDKNNIASIYFNEFQTEQVTESATIEIDVNDRFVMDNTNYSIDYSNGTPRVMFYLAEDNPFEEKFLGEIIDDEIVINGVKYNLTKDDSGRYVSITFAKANNTKLKKILISDYGVGEYSKANLEFQFDGSVSVVVCRFHQSKVQDELVQEWCEYDDEKNVEITDNKTWDWNIYTKLKQISNTYPQHSSGITSLGSGNLYTGEMRTTGTIKFYNQLQGSNITTNGKIVIGSGEVVKEINLGVILNYNFQIPNKKIIIGNQSIDGLIEEDSSGKTAFIKKDIDIGNNFINMVWMDIERINPILQGQYLTYVGDSTTNEDGKIEITPLESDQYLSNDITLTQNIYTNTQTYSIEIKNWANGNNFVATKTDSTIQFLLDRRTGSGTVVYDRYKLDCDSGKLYRVEIQDIVCQTIDFSTQYSFEQLRNNLVSNIKQYMMNSSIQSLVDNRNNYGIVAISPKNLDLYLDLFSNDSQGSNFTLVSGNGSETSAYQKFIEVFKNNQLEVDGSQIYKGSIYEYTSGVISKVFQSDTKSATNSITLVDTPSIQVTREEKVDKFKYKVYFDLYIRADKKLLNSSKGKSELKNKYILGSVVIKDLCCSITIEPHFNSKSVMTYSSKYEITNSGQVQVEYNQVIYNNDGKVQYKTIDTQAIEVGLKPETIQLFKYSLENMNIEQLPSETLTSVIDNILTKTNLSKLFIDINNSEQVSGNQEVGTYQIQNDGILNSDGSKTWYLDQKIPVSLDTVSKISRGNAIINDQVYQVMQDEDASGNITSWLKQTDGDNRFDLVKIFTHKSDDPSQTQEVTACIGEEVASQDEFNKNFYLAQDGDYIMAVFKDGRDPMKVIDKDGGFTLGTIDVVKLTTEIDGSNGETINQVQENSTITVNKTYGVIDSASQEQTVVINPTLELDTETNIQFSTSDIVNDSFEKDIPFAYSQDTSNLITWNTETQGSKPTNITSITETKCCIGGKVSVKISNISSGNPIVELNTSKCSPCRTIESPLEGFTGGNLSKMSNSLIYTPIGIDSNSINVQNDENSIYTITLSLIAKVKYETLYVKPTTESQNYFAGGFYIRYNKSPIHAFTALDMLGGTSNDLNYFIIGYPENIDEWITKGNGTWDDMSFKYVYVNKNGLNITSNARYCPYSMGVLAPGKTRTNDWDIYDRYYIVEKKLEFQKANINESQEAKYFWIDSSSTINSFNIGVENITWRGVENITWKCLLDDSFTENIKQSITKCVTNAIFLDESYFSIMLTQLQTFLKTIDSELKQQLSVQDIINLCQFNYTTTIAFKTYSEQKNSWDDASIGLFDKNSQQYQSCLTFFNSHLYNDFYQDFSNLSDNIDTSIVDDRDYKNILLQGVTSTSIIQKRDETLQELYSLVCEKVGTGESNLIDEIFGSNYNDTEEDKTANTNNVRYINVLDTNIYGEIVDMHVCDGYCHLFTKENGFIQWHSFDESYDSVKSLLENKKLMPNGYVVDIPTKILPFQVNTKSNWVFRFANRNLAKQANIPDGFVVLCSWNDTDIWYLSNLSGYIYTDDGTEIHDLVYDYFTDSVYIVFKDDNNIYRYDNLGQSKDSDGKIFVSVNNYTKKIVNYDSIITSTVTPTIKWIYLDYPDKNSKSYLKIFSEFNDKPLVETWHGVLNGSGIGNFKQYNTILFGDSLFSTNQMKFQNISKNMEMFDILDIDEVDGCYYGVFKNEDQNESQQIYTVFKTSNESSGVVERLPQELVLPNLFKTNDWLYSLYVLVRVPYEDEHGNIVYKQRLEEISLPSSDIYQYRTISIQDAIMGDLNAQNSSEYDLKIEQLFLSEWVPGSKKSSFFALTNKGLYKIGYDSDEEQLSIDTLDAFKEALLNEDDTSLRSVIKHHYEEKHESEDSKNYFETIGNKVNQLKDDFSAFNLIPVEFGETQDVGVVPTSEVETDDEVEDHRTNSLQVSTDILYTDGLALNSDQNPGLIVAAVSNPATTYDDESFIGKSQRNPDLEGTEFYDYIYDQDGTELMNLYAIPFVFRINSNNTYDLYVNIPTTRTKYLNRLSGTLKDDLTTLVTDGDTRTRINFHTEDEPFSNNLTESTTKLRLYIDRKYISIGNVELVEICGNSIPCLIYRDTPNNGLYDSIALESRWDGEVNEINEPAKDINKVMLEFECYGTDSQSIHISGKTLINKYLDDTTYDQGS